MSAIQVITFDAAGTLIVPHPSVGEIYAEVLQNHGISGDAERIERNFRKIFRREQAKSSDALLEPRAFWKIIVEEAISDFCPAQELDSVFEELWNCFGEGRRWRLLDEVQPALNELQALDVRMAVLSNNDSRLRTVLQDLGIAAFFEQVFISSELGHGKPDPMVFRCVEKAFRLPPSCFLHVGDDPVRDAAAARNAGWEAILVTKEDGDGLRVGNLSEVPRHLAAISA